MLRITDSLFVPEREIDFQHLRAQGPGGQHLNKASTAVELRFDVRRSSLPVAVKQRLLARSDQRLSRDGVIRIRAQEHRSQERNREAALERLAGMVREAARPQRSRRPTRVPAAERHRRLEGKLRRGRLKRLRGRLPPNGSDA